MQAMVVGDGDRTQAGFLELIRLSAGFTLPCSSPK